MSPTSSKRLTTVSACLLAFIAAGCGAAASESTPPPSPAAPGSVPTDRALVMGLLGAETDVLETVIADPPPPFAGKRLWLYARVSETTGPDGVLPYWQALLLAVALNDRETAGNEVDGVSIASPTTSGCAELTSDGCEAPGSPLPADLTLPDPIFDQDAVASEITKNLARIGLKAASISFEPVRSSSAPVVVATTDDPKAWARTDNVGLADIFGHLDRFPGVYLLVNDADGSPVTAEAAVPSLGQGLGWIRPSLDPDPEPGTG